MKKYIAITILIAILGAALFGVGAVAYAATLPIDSSNVLDDLQGSIVDGKKFDADAYDYSDEKEPRLLSFAEFGYSYDKFTAGDYSLYLYIYNPSGRKIRNTELNKIGIATVYENGFAVDYEKFGLQLLSASEGKYAYLFYKFKVKDSGKIWTRVTGSTNKRRYDVSEIELNFGEPTSETFTVGNYYEYSGFAKGYGADSASDDTLTCFSDAIQSLKLEVYHANYVYNNGDKIKSNVHNAYFGVPSEIFDDFGALQQIKLNYYLTFTGMQYFVYDLSYYDFLKDYLGYTGYRIPVTSFTDSLGKKPKAIAGWNGAEANMTTYPNGVALPWWYDYGAGSYDVLNSFSSDNLRWLFPLNKSDNYMVTAAQVAQYAQDYTSEFSKILAGAPNNADELLLDKYLSHLFIDMSKYATDYTFKTNNYVYPLHFGWQGNDGKGVVIDADNKFTVSGFETTDTGLKRWWNNLLGNYDGFDTKPLEDLDPIYIVKDSDFLGTDEQVAARLCIGENELATFKAKYDENKLQGKKTVILRYLVSPYLVDDMTAQLSSTSSKKIGYTVQQAVALDFDLIWLKFVKENVSTVVPAVARPTDAFTGFKPWEPIPEYPSNNGLNLVAVVLAIVVVVLIVFCIVKLFGGSKNKSSKRK